MPKKTQKPDIRPITITLTIDPTLKLNAQGERAMATTIIARRGDVAQLGQLDVTNWKTDLPAEVDRLVRLLLSNGLVLPDFPKMDDVKATGEAQDDEPGEPEGDEDEAMSPMGDMETGEEVEQEPDEASEPAFDEGLSPATAVEIDDEIRNEGEPEPEPYFEVEEAEGELPPIA